MKKLRGEENYDKIDNGRDDKKIRRFLYYTDALDMNASTGRYVTNCPMLACMSRHNDKQKGRELKFFNCTVLYKIISLGTHLEMELAPHDLFNLIWSIRGNNLHRNQC